VFGAASRGATLSLRWRAYLVPARILLVFDDEQFLASAVARLRDAGHDAAGVLDPMSALAAMSRAHNVELLVTRIAFTPGQPHGVALALMARHNRAYPRCELKVLFIARAEYRDAAVGIGEFMELPIAIPDLVAAANRLLA